MKKTAQISLICIILIALVLFNKKYFSKNKEIEAEPNIPKKELSKKNENNIIKNLKYEITLDKDNQYFISSDLSELVNLDNSEIVMMQKVTGIIIDKNKIPLIITSEKAEYNSSSHNTKFRGNVIITYLNNKIVSEKLDLSFEKNIAKIYEKVKYSGSQGIITADNIKINLMTKKIDIYMDNQIDNVKLFKN